MLRYLEDRTEAETADLMGCSVGTVKSQCSKALAKLRVDASTWRVADPVDPVTGEVLRIRTPPDLAPGSELRLFQWLVDGVFALVAMDQHRHDNGAIVLCTLTDLSCTVVDPGPGDFTPSVTPSVWGWGVWWQERREGIQLAARVPTTSANPEPEALASVVHAGV